MARETTDFSAGQAVRVKYMGHEYNGMIFRDNKIGDYYVVEINSVVVDERQVGRSKIAVKPRRLLLLPEEIEHCETGS